MSAKRLLVVFLLSTVYVATLADIAIPPINPCATVLCAPPKACGPGEKPTGCCPCKSLPITSCLGVMCTMELRYCGVGEKPQGCCPCTPRPITSCVGVMCPMVVRYCDIGETPQGCCPCHIRPISAQIAAIVAQLNELLHALLGLAGKKAD